MESCSDSVFLQRCKVVGLGFCRWDISDRLEQAAVIEPVDPFKRGVFDCVHGFPWAFPPDDFSLVESIDGFGEGVVITVTDTADRRLEASFCQTLCIPYADILAAAIRVMNKTTSDARPSIVQGLLKSIEHKARMCRPADPPADYAAGEHIDHEGNVDEPGPGRDVGEIADPEPVRCRGLEVAVHMVERARRCLVAVGRSMRLAADNALQPHGLHQAPDGATCHVKAFPLHLVPDLVGAIDDPSASAPAPGQITGIALQRMRDAVAARFKGQFEVSGCGQGDWWPAGVLQAPPN